MFVTLMNTAYGLLINVVIYIITIPVVAGAIAAMLSECGVI